MDGEHLLQAILDDPADDTGRLVYADWLEEQGEVGRAELVRVQVEMAGHLQQYSFPVDRVSFLRRRERELLSVHRSTWLEPIVRLFGHNCPLEASDTIGWAVEFRHGFVAEVCLSQAAWLEHGPALVQACPLEKVTLSDKRPLHYSDQDGRWGWYGHTPHVLVEEISHFWLPGALFALLPGGLRSRSPHGRRYPSAEAALAALSDACLVWARNHQLVRS